ncbi:4-oxalmesaconate hydratase [Marinomonas gallaica]|uniref:4-oxalmesaconate hydratase n=1 Tax=Marinomonas gallaica TaxID=1806667 RepID=A0A1C3JQQ3_9GAMM|nr:PIG-L deacetylase family protein [Marinomonas gallaica]SBT17581.1 4-oxalmesaconate hydratase [Marinomonas gallaica]SBT19907.1 4-oxalmesaconate hydratase [Marinomonas gallaica]
MSSPQKTALVISAHSADFVWRAGGAITAHVKQGWKVRIICLSYGERGESAKLWRVPNMTMDRVKDTRQREAQAAADILGAEIEFWDLEDYPLRISDDTLFRLVDTYRTLQPEFVLSHSEHDPYNFDHPLAMRAAQEARILAQAEGHNPGQKILGAPPVYAFEPHQTEQCQWQPNTFLDITDVWKLKRQAIECMAGQEHLWDYYTRVALQRGVQAKRNIGITAKRHIEYAEAYMRLTPLVVEQL